MKRIFVLLALTLVMCLSVVPAFAADNAADMKIAMISDYGGITDQSFNQTIYEACRAYSQAQGTPFVCFQPVQNNNEARMNVIEDAVKQGYNVVVTAGDSFVDALKTTAQVHPEAKFIAIDVSQERLGNYTLPENFYGVVYREELSGYMAGYAAVKLGYHKLGYLGGTDIPPVRRYGYGFVQGINAAADELGLQDVTVNYAYARQFEPSTEITWAMDRWYRNGIQIVLSCGGLYESVASAAESKNGKVIGIDVDQSGVIDNQFTKGMTVTSAMKDLSGAVRMALNRIAAGSFRGGQVETLGIVSSDPMKNYVQLPIGTTQWNKKFSQNDYRDLVRKLYQDKIKVFDDINKLPADYATHITLMYNDTIN